MDSVLVYFVNIIVPFVVKNSRTMKMILISVVLIASILQMHPQLFAQKSNNPQTEKSVSPEMTPPDSTMKADSLSCGLLLYEGQIYHTVKIGRQCWMSDNLNIGKWTDESQIQKESDNGVIEKYCYGNDFTQCDFWGGLYQWNELMAYSQIAGAQGICPPGWHVPSSQDWKTLIRFLGMNTEAGGKLKSTLQWQTPNVGATNNSGFSAYPGGYYDFMAKQWHDLYREGYYWSSEIITKGTAVAIYLEYRTSGIEMYEEYQPSALSVRCIKN
jgi:uncharacterized protein (TIGR02145 family)